jgi:uncharacterized protein (TIGR00251 family)
VALITASPSGSIVAVRVSTRAARSEISGVRNDVLHVRLTAAPVEGAANEALITLFARTFNLPKRGVRIVAGARSRTKRVELVGIDPPALASRLEGLLPTA